MPKFIDFARLHPDVEMEILSSDESVKLTNREADVTIRVVHDRNALPHNFHGLKGPELFSGVYMSRHLLVGWRAERPIALMGSWNWARDSEVPIAEAPFRTTGPGCRSSQCGRGSE
jgi:DNA-binding transcriptional LysR family regulator